MPTWRIGPYFPHGRPSTVDPNAIPDWILQEALFAIRADYTLQSSGRITQFTDQTGNGHHWVEDTGDTGPQYTAIGINGKPSAVLTNDYVMNTTIGTGLTGGEIWMVGQFDTNTPGATGHWSIGDHGQHDHFPYSDDHIYDGFGSTTRQQVNGPWSQIMFDDPYCYNVTSTASEWTARMNEVEEFTTATNTVTWVSTKLLFTSIGHASFFQNGLVAEVIMFDRACTVQERIDMHSYLRGRYGYP